MRVVWALVVLCVLILGGCMAGTYIGHRMKPLDPGFPTFTPP